MATGGTSSFDTGALPLVLPLGACFVRMRLRTWGAMWCLLGASRPEITWSCEAVRASLGHVHDAAQGVLRPQSQRSLLRVPASAAAAADLVRSGEIWWDPVRSGEIR